MVSPIFFPEKNSRPSFCHNLLYSTHGCRPYFSLSKSWRPFFSHHPCRLPPFDVDSPVFFIISATIFSFGCHPLDGVPPVTPLRVLKGSHSFLPANGMNHGMNHICLFLSSRSWSSGWRLSSPAWPVTYRNKCPAPGIEPAHGHPSKY